MIISVTIDLILLMRLFAVCLAISSCLGLECSLAVIVVERVVNFAKRLLPVVHH